MKNKKLLKKLGQVNDMLEDMIDFYEKVLDGVIDDPALNAMSRSELVDLVRDLNDKNDEVCDLYVGIFSGNFSDDDVSRALDVIEFWGIE